jgi:glyoxylase-like metal-dependent hydrolase (beta-lactamase superfamily II)
LHELSLGRLQFCVLDDGALPFPAAFFFAKVPESLWRRELETDRDGKIPVGHNYGLLETPDDLVVFDTGYGDDTHAGRTGHLIDELERSGYRREQVTKVVNTHAHGDHIKRNTSILNGRREPTFPNAVYYLARQDWEWFSGPAHVPEFDEHIRPLDAWGILRLFDAPLRLTREVLLLPTPGHTPGHTTAVMESQGHTLMYWGDLCHLPLHFSHPQWTSAFDTDPAMTPRSRAQLFALALERDALIVCPHAPAPGIGRLRRIDNAVMWRAVQ